MLTLRPFRKLNRRAAALRREVSRRLSLMLETCEDRVLLASIGVLQGIVYQSGGAPMANATVLLEKLDSPPISNQTVTTDATGVYTFQELPAGQYRITQTPPAGYRNVSSQVNSPLTPVLNQTSSSVDVQIGDFSALLVDYVSHNKQVESVTNNGLSREGLIGQLNIRVDQPDISLTTPLIASFCIDFYRDFFTGETDQPFEGKSLTAGFAADPRVLNPENAGEIAWLYNHIGSKWSTDPGSYVPVAEAAGFQLAIWELMYEDNPAPYDVLTGTFFVEGRNSSSPDVIAAQNFLAQAQGKNELAIYLDGLPTDNRPEGSQSVIVPGSLDFTNEPSGGGPTTPNIATTPDTTSITLGQTAPTLRDTAVLSQGNDPTGTITFTLFLNNALVHTEVVNVSGNGSYTTPAGYTLPNTGTVTGTYQWNASYSGDTNNNPVSEEGSPNERVTVDPAGPAISTTPNVTEVTLGTSQVVLRDTAQLTGGFNPTGTITFTLFQGSTLVHTEVVNVSGNGSYTTATGYTLPNTGTVTGTYQWNASYSGDGNNTSVSEQGNVNERVTVDPASTLIATTPNPTSVNLGTTPVVLKDSATLSGGYFPTGTITFTLSFEGAVLDTETVIVNGNGIYTTPTGYTLSPGAAAGIYQWNATYIGDGNNAEVSEIGSPTEQVTVNTAPPAPVPLTGLVYCDMNNDGIPDPTDPRIAGVTVVLTGTDSNDNPVELTTQTQQDGTYVFSVLAGTYTVTETPPQGYLNGIVSVGTAGGTVNGRSVTGIELSEDPPSIATGYNFAHLMLSSLAGVVYCDEDFNGVINPNDPRVAGVTVLLTGTNDLNQSISQTLTTDANGAFEFGGLRLGTYDIRIVTLAGYLPFATNVGSLGGTPGTNEVSGISLLFCDEGTDYDFGFVLAARLGGFVYEDCDNTGTKTPDEMGIPGVTITLVGTDITGASVNRTTTTGSDGAYQFNDLYPGTYSVIEAQPSGFFQGRVTLGTVDGRPVGSVGEDSITGILLGKGSVGVNYNFGELKPSTLSGIVYFDIFHNCKLDPNDFGIANVVVNLSGTNDLGQSIALTTVTNADGFYAFNGLRPGTYNIERVQPRVFRAYCNSAGSAGGTATDNSIDSITLTACTDGVNYNFGELQRPGCRLRDLAIHVGNTFYHFQRTYERDPGGFARNYPNMVDQVAAGEVPWGKAPFPRAAAATYWVPRLGTRPIRVFPVNANVSAFRARPTLHAPRGLARAAARAR